MVINGSGVAILVRGNGGDSGGGAAGGVGGSGSGGGGGDAGDGGCTTISGVLMILPLPKSYTQVLNHFRPILRFVPALTLDAR